MLARYYSAGLSRFLPVDPGDDSDLENPQSWNKYTYVGNNPLKYADPEGQFKIVGSNRHQNVTRKALPAKDRFVNRADVIKGNRRADTNRKRSDLPNHLNTNQNAAPGSTSDSRVQHATGQLGEALRQFAAGDSAAAGATLGNGMHSLDDLVAHGNATKEEHYSDANGGNMDSSNSPGIDIRFDAAVGLEGAVMGIFDQAASGIMGGGDVGALVAGAQAQAAAAAQNAYSSTKAKLEQAGAKPEGY